MSLTITLPDALARIVEEKVAAGHYERPVDVVAAGLFALAEEPEIDPAELKRLWDKGIASGIAEGVTTESILREARERFNRR